MRLELIRSFLFVQYCGDVMKYLFAALIAVGVVAGAYYYKKKNAVMKGIKGIEAVDAGTSLLTGITIEEECFLGELDYIMNHNSVDSELLLTIEPLLSQNSDTVLRKKLPVTSIDAKYKTEFDFRPFLRLGNLNLGLFICSDKARTGECQSKQIIDFTKPKEFKSQKNTKKDYMYYFQYIASFAGKLGFLEYSGLTDEQIVERLKFLISKGEGKGNKMTIEKIFRYAEYNLKNLGSVGIGVERFNSKYQLQMVLKKFGRDCDVGAKVNNFYKKKSGKRKVEEKWHTLKKTRRN